MKSKIIEKINNVIAKGIKEESDVFYLVGQSRKYLETSYKKAEKEIKYPTLSLVADWILHSKLTGGAAKMKLEEYSDFFTTAKDNDVFEFMTSGFTLFPDLRSDLESFCMDAQIDTSFIKTKNTWNKFIGLLVDILTDLPLVSNGDVKSFTFHDGFVTDETKAITFTVAFSNGRNISCTIDVEILSI